MGTFRLSFRGVVVFRKSVGNSLYFGYFRLLGNGLFVGVFKVVLCLFFGCVDVGEFRYGVDFVFSGLFMLFLLTVCCWALSWSSKESCE